MLKQRTDAGDKIVAALHAAESSIETCGIDLHHVAFVMNQARRDTGVGLAVGGEAIALVNVAVAAVIEAQRALVDAHKALDGVAHQTGMARAYGKENPPMMLAGRRVRAVRMQPTG